MEYKAVKVGNKWGIVAKVVRRFLFWKWEKWVPIGKWYDYETFFPAIFNTETAADLAIRDLVLEREREEAENSMMRGNWIGRQPIP